eukprot:CAMPEP_0117599430 /NCGR_PEP_ID=MMETSP0784-20121206/75948_1 /TAXON_ID=39447 /ORGANISM="" /LENGTH=35 /DNA_ID= /DNA_START= /DNA_END= /DNA_ORIENTATION=
MVMPSRITKHVSRGVHGPEVARMTAQARRSGVHDW